MIGAGSGGLSVAAAAAAFGVEVVLVERGRMGGDCLNHGCVPSKSLIAAAARAEAMREAGRFGIAPVAPDVDPQAVREHVRGVIAAIAPNDSAERFRDLGVNVIAGEARFIDPRTVMVGDRRIRARRFVIATGSAPSLPPIDGLAEVEPLTNETIFELGTRPDHLLVLGAGPVGLELAQAHLRLGSRVTVVEQAAALAREDPETAAIALARLRAEGVTLIENCKVTSAERRAGGAVALRVAMSSGETKTLEGSHLLVATGRRPDLAALDLARAGIRHDAKGVSVDDRLRTSNRRVYAIGDAAGGPQFTHVANYHAGLVVRAILFRLPARVDYRALPQATFLDPELCQIGLTEAEARERFEKVSVLRSGYGENDRARTRHAEEGLVKLVADRRGRLIGVSIVGAQAAEMGNFWSLAISRGMRLRDIASFVSPYPTFGEIGKRAAMSYFAGMARRPSLRRIVRLLRHFG